MIICELVAGVVTCHTKNFFLTFFSYKNKVFVSILLAHVFHCSGMKLNYPGIRFIIDPNSWLLLMWALISGEVSANWTRQLTVLWNVEKHWKSNLVLKTAPCWAELQVPGKAQDAKMSSWTVQVSKSVVCFWHFNSICNSYATQNAAGVWWSLLINCVNFGQFWGWGSSVSIEHLKLS